MCRAESSRWKTGAEASCRCGWQWSWALEQIPAGPNCSLLHRSIVWWDIAGYNDAHKGEDNCNLAIPVAATFPDKHLSYLIYTECFPWWASDNVISTRHLSTVINDQLFYFWAFLSCIRAWVDLSPKPNMVPSRDPRVLETLTNLLKPEDPTPIINQWPK